MSAAETAAYVARDAADKAQADLQRLKVRLDEQQAAIDLLKGEVESFRACIRVLLDTLGRKELEERKRG